MRIGEANFENEIKRSISGLLNAHQGPLIRFLPLILDKLLQIMVRPPLIAGQIGKSFVLIMSIFIVVLSSVLFVIK